MPAAKHVTLAHVGMQQANNQMPAAKDITTLSPLPQQQKQGPHNTQQCSTWCSTWPGRQAHCWEPWKSAVLDTHTSLQLFTASGLPQAQSHIHSFHHLCIFIAGTTKPNTPQCYMNVNTE
jgi:hypothetical protein